MKTALSFMLFCATSFASIPSISGTDIATGRKVNWKPGDKKAVLVFLSAECPCSQSHESSLQKLATKYSDTQFIGIVSNAARDTDNIQSHFGKTSFAFPVLKEDGHVWADALGATQTPHAFLVDKAGEIVFRGGVDDSRDAARAEKLYLANALQAIQEGKKVPVALARAVGCSIRR